MVNVTDSALIPPEASMIEIPYLAMSLLMGAEVVEKYKGNKDAVGLRWNGEIRQEVARQDFQKARELADILDKKMVLPKGRVVSPWDVHYAYRMAVAEYKRDKRAGKGICMVKDRGGCGYWRMTLPAKYMNTDGIFVDVSSGTIKYEWLLEYDTVMVQRVHDWESYYVLGRLKQAGKRIIYDLDDDIFAIDPDNPAASVIGREEQLAAIECMKLADEVTTTTDKLQLKLVHILRDMGEEKTPVVIPNAMDPEDNWPKIEDIGSPDGWQRMFWQGSATHGVDWEQCIEAVDNVMRKRTNLRMTILGFLPPVVQERLSMPHWKGRVEWMGFNAPETYFRLVRNIRAEVGLAPLRTSNFSAGKCVDTKMRVTTNAGIVEAGKIKSGMKVWRNGWRNVIAVQTDNPRNGFRIETKDGYRLDLSAEHRMMVDGKWKMVKDIGLGDKMNMSEENSYKSDCVSVPWPSDSRMNSLGRKRRLRDNGYAPSDPLSFLTADDVPRLEITPRWGRIIGAYVGDGCATRTALTISCDGIDQDWIEKLMSDFKACGFNPTTESVKTFGGKIIRRRNVRVASAHLIRVFESLGLVRKRTGKSPIRNVCVPEIIWNSPKEVIREFLAGYFEADGYVNKSSVESSSKSESLIRDIQRLLLVFGITSKVWSRIHRCQTCTDVYWHIRLVMDATRFFEKEIGFNSVRKNKKLHDVTHKKHGNSVSTKPMIWMDEVLSITPIDITPVDIQVEGEEFVLAGFVSHNSCIKWQEYSLIGMPTVASDTSPYNDSINHERTGLLARNTKEWEDAITVCLDHAAERKRMVMEARKVIEQDFNIRNIANEWKDLLIG